jgi:hypothetical protein
MTECFAGLVYGVNAKAGDVVAAVRAYAQVRLTLAGLQIIHRRLERGFLRATHTVKRKRYPFGFTTTTRPSAIERVPCEVWAMIEQEVITAAVREARLEVVDQLLCIECRRARAQDTADDLVSDGHTPESTPSLVKHCELVLKHERATAAQARVWDPDWVEATYLCEGNCIANPNQMTLERTTGSAFQTKVSEPESRY